MNKSLCLVKPKKLLEIWKMWIIKCFSVLVTHSETLPFLPESQIPVFCPLDAVSQPPARCCEQEAEAAGIKDIKKQQVSCVCVCVYTCWKGALTWLASGRGGLVPTRRERAENRLDRFLCMPGICSLPSWPFTSAGACSMKQTYWPLETWITELKRSARQQRLADCCCVVWTLRPPHSLLRTSAGLQRLDPGKFGLRFAQWQEVRACCPSLIEVNDLHIGPCAVSSQQCAVAVWRLE